MDDNELMEGGPCHKCGTPATCGTEDDEHGVIYWCEDCWMLPKREVGDTAYFEYHCNQSHSSPDAAAWYRSHQPVTIVERTLVAEDATMWAYKVRFPDGHVHQVFEDELHDDPSLYGTQAETKDGFGPPPLHELQAHDPAYAQWAIRHGYYTEPAEA